LAKLFERNEAMFQKMLSKPFLMALTLAVAFAMTPGSVKAQHGGGGGGGQIGISAALLGTDNDPDALGLADFRAQGNQVRLEVEVQDVTYSADVLVLINGAVVTEMLLSDGSGFVELEVEHIGGVFYYGPPQGDSIVIEAGDEIDIIDAGAGTLLLVGVFQ
jgi:hypothetical protein